MNEAEAPVKAAEVLADWHHSSCHYGCTMYPSQCGRDHERPGDCTCGLSAALLSYSKGHGVAISEEGEVLVLERYGHLWYENQFTRELSEIKADDPDFDEGDGDPLYRLTTPEADRG